MVKTSVFYTVILILNALLCTAQDTSRYVVLFKDKKNTPYTINKPREFLSNKAIQRKNRVITQEDLPVDPNYIIQLEAIPTTVIHTTKWLNGALVEAADHTLSTIQSLPFVDSVALIARGKKTTKGGRVSHSQNQNQSGISPHIQQEMLDIDVMHSDGYYGDGIMIAVFDGGFDGVDQASYFQYLGEESRLIDEYNFVTDDQDIYGYSDHGTKVFSTIGASGDGYEGIATSSRFLLYVTEDVSSEYRIEEYNWLIAAERADSIGADIITSSLGYYDFDDPTMNYTHSDLDGKTAVITKAAEMVYERGMVVVTSAGNQGNKTWQKVTFPADGEHVLAIGSVDGFGRRSVFSSLGPVSGTWTKPDLMAMGSNTVLIGFGGSISISSGTSFAAPQVAGLIAGIWEKYPELTNENISDMLKMSADRAGEPNSEYGFGIPSYVGFENFYNSAPDRDFYTLYPNPVTNGYINIEVGNPNLIENFINVEIYTPDGKRVKQTDATVNWRNNPISVSLEELSQGFYLIKLTSTEKTEVLRIMKQL